MTDRSKSPAAMRAQDPPNPKPLPSPDYGIELPQDESCSNSGDFDVLTDEILLIRARMGVLFRAGVQPGLTPSRLAATVELFSRAAARLARLLLRRQEIYHLHMGSPQHFAERFLGNLDAARELEELGAIRSSKNSSFNFFIENPLTLSPLVREVLKPFLYSGEKGALPSGIRGRPAADLFAVLEGVLHKFLTDTPWIHLPLNYPSYSTCYRYYAIWLRSGLLEKLLFFLSLVLFSDEMTEQQAQEETFGDIFRIFHEIEEASHASENISAPSYRAAFPLEKDDK